MQDIHALGGGGIFNTGGGGGGDRRLRPHNQSHQTLKCPRCDSLNTKFCYYNNYNLSQPRHFCKGCRRYWTKGGVLRNVPVGGGCRKAKRSKAKHSSAARTQRDDDVSKANSRSSSESSSTLTAVASSSGEAASLLKVKESSGRVDEQQGSVFAEAGNFTSLINSSCSKETTAYGFSSMLNNQEQWQGSVMMMDPTVAGEFSGVRSGLGALDWQGGGDHQSLFDLHLPNTLDQTYSWNQTQWSDQDHPGLYLP